MAAKRQEWTVVAMLEWATEYFEKKDVPDARFSIEWLLADVLEMKRLDLYLCFDRPLSGDELNKLRWLVKRRAKHEPLQYITGESEFMNARLNVCPAVLIPRPETEQLVEVVLENHSSESELSVLDIGTGSGCIAIALKMERSDWSITALDNSAKALDVAKENAEKNEVDITFWKYDILDNRQFPVHDSFDVIISNPPYVLPEEKNMLEPQVVNYEPAEALFCKNIERMYQKIIQQSLANLKSKGSLYLEIHANHNEKILSLLNRPRWEVKELRDYSKKHRFIHAKRRK